MEWTPVSISRHPPAIHISGPLTPLYEPRSHLRCNKETNSFSSKSKFLKVLHSFFATNCCWQYLSSLFHPPAYGRSWVRNPWFPPPHNVTKCFIAIAVLRECCAVLVRSKVNNRVNLENALRRLNVELGLLRHRTASPQKNCFCTSRIQERRVRMAPPSGVNGQINSQRFANGEQSVPLGWHRSMFGGATRLHLRLDCHPRASLNINQATVDEVVWQQAFPGHVLLLTSGDEY